MTCKYLIITRERIYNNGTILNDKGLKALNGYHEFIFEYIQDATEIDVAEAFLYSHQDLRFDECEIIRL